MNISYHKEMEIYISSLAFLGKTIDQIIEEAVKGKLSIEFSSGIAHDPSAVEKIDKCKFPKYIHNYFPAPKDPFVLNLASSDEAIRQASIEHTIRGLEISKQIGADFFLFMRAFVLTQLQMN